MKIQNKQDLDVVINALVDLVDEVFDGSQELIAVDSLLRTIKTRLGEELV